VRGIPRPAGVEDGDSSDLPDSDDEVMPSATALKAAKKQNGIEPIIPHQGAALGTGTLRRSGSGRDAPLGSFAGASPTRSRGANFMNILRRKKDPSAKVRKADIESAARRDTPLERSRYDLQAVKRNDSYNSTGSGKGRLQKRNALTSWPLPPPESGAAELEANDTRPHTADAADGIVGGELSNGVAAIGSETAVENKPGLGSRRTTTESLPTELGVNGVANKARKKKFGRLRKMFRLDE
jgi:serine/arginine repetitive matrix protein 2